jgi:hypothetical protein
MLVNSNNYRLSLTSCQALRIGGYYIGAELECRPLELATDVMASRYNHKGSPSVARLCASGLIASESVECRAEAAASRFLV